MTSMIRTGTMVLGLALLAAVSSAEGPGLKVASGTTLREVLAGQTGQTVTLRLRGGEELSGKVQTVGDQVAHLSALTGRDFYDAVVRLDGIDAVIVRARGN